MKPKPLNGAEYYAEELYYGEGDGNRIKVFTGDDVKSAVELLVQKIKRIDGLKYVYYDDKAKKWFFDYEKLKEDIINLIKEAFEDVVK